MSAISIYFDLFDKNHENNIKVRTNNKKKNITHTIFSFKH